MNANEMRALGKLAGRAVGRPAIVARDVHRAVSGRTFDALGVLGLPARGLHDGISQLAYRSVTGALIRPLTAAAAAASRRAPTEGAALEDAPLGSIALAVLNGAVGDALAREYDELALRLTVRCGGRRVETNPRALADAFPGASPKLAVFVHGLGETEEAWRLLSPAGRRSGTTYGSRLRDELGYTPVYIRYNTGLHVSDNGRRLAAVLDELVEGWPAEVQEIAFVAHSMGGLVARSACHYGGAEDQRWTRRVRHVLCLGTPHLGAPLEKAANVAGWTLGRLAETRPFADLVNTRSAGIKDLRYGSCIEEDWSDCDCDELLRDRCGDVPFLPDARYYYIGAILTARPGDRMGTVIGDLLVTFPSASGQGTKRRIPFEIDDGCHLGGLNHFQLLNHPAVYEQIRVWLRRGGVPEVGEAARLSA